MSTPSPRLQPNDRAVLLHDIRRGIARHGYAHLAFPHEREEYERIAAALGTVSLRTDVRIDARLDRRLSHSRAADPKRKRPGVHRPQGLSLHSDRPTVSLLSFHCLVQDERDGAQILVDTADIASCFSTAELAALENIRIPFSQRDPATNVETYGYQPLVSGTGGRHHVYFADWFLPEPRDMEEARLFDKLLAYVTDRRERAAISIRLAPGESVFLDNRRMLHGREAIPTDSRRHLLRLFIETPVPVGAWETLS